MHLYLECISCIRVASTFNKKITVSKAKTPKQVYWVCVCENVEWYITDVHSKASLT